MPAPLDQVKVVSFETALSGPFTTMLLADFGAEVVIIERPGSRTDVPHDSFLYRSRGKRSLTLDLKKPQGVDLARRLIATADIVLENFRPGVMARLGLDYASVCPLRPELVYASISGFGQTGPDAHRAAYDMLAQGTGGTISLTGPEDPDAPPVRVGYSIGDLGAALFAANGILAAYVNRLRSGTGQHIDISMIDCQVALCGVELVQYLRSGVLPRPLGSRHQINTPFQIYPTKDRPMALVAHEDRDWRNFCTAAGKPEWIGHARYGTSGLRGKHFADFDREMRALLTARTYDEWATLFNPHEVIYGPVNTMADLANDARLHAREMIVELEHPVIGKHRMAGNPVKFSHTPTAVGKPSPCLGADTQDLLAARLGLLPEEIAALRANGVI